MVDDSSDGARNDDVSYPGRASISGDDDGGGGGKTTILVHNVGSLSW
jgi:hypothetical protein